ncbi:RNA-binding protein 48-like [Acipenser ruthenus]|uniref:RNA-binding protein 48-like n=1 Tax=Acipenser ruthenus TaxID=7906 RepID=UPI00274164CE|nr:RNA-binding protein 48-like [Acipenser ruthenus]
MAASSWKTLEVCKHHEQKDVCFSRAKYRERRPTAVRVYTINLESCYLLIPGVPAVGVMTELVQLFAIYGAVEEYRVLDDYPAEWGSSFTEVYLIKFQNLQSARIAKRKLDERSFFGGLLHVCYAPEFETVQDTREKIKTCIKQQKYVEPDTSKEVVNNLQKETTEIETERSPPSDRRKYHGSKEASFTMTNTSVARFIPRTTHLQDRKRRKEQVAVDSLIGIDKNDAEIFVGPKLPEEPKVDDSLNMSVDFIRNRL